jgi:predicted dehydrogenase
MMRAAIVGVGTWGQNLVNSVQGKSDKIKFVAGVTGKATEFCTRCGLDVLSFEETLRRKDIDGVVLATPHSTHGEQIVAAAKAGKHVFVEKPLGIDHQDAGRAVKACKDAGVVLMVGYNWRFQPALREIKRMLEDGRLGKLCHIEGNFCGPSAYRAQGHWRHDVEHEAPAGGMTGRGVHVVDAMLYLAGHIDSVSAQSERLVQDFGMDDTTSMLFRFKGGATGYLGTFVATAETWRMQVFGARGWVEVGGIEHLPAWEMRVGRLNENDLWKKTPPEVVKFPPVSTERAELEHFAESALARRPVAIPGGDEVHNVAVLEAIVASSKSGQRVKVND